jgi:proteasome lid subunit RPN8/RPN11
MIPNKKLFSEIVEHVDSSPRKEICGLIIAKDRRQVYFPCKNTSDTIDTFKIDPVDFMKAEEMGKITCCVHSHINKNPAPSQSDLVEIERNNLPYLIINYPLHTYTYTEPTGYQAPYVGRQFVHGVTDCYSLFVDYYKRELNIGLSEYLDRKDEWWTKGQDLIRLNYSKENLIEVQLKDIIPSDVLFIQTRSKVINHCAIYLEGNRILHHMSNRLSMIEPYGGYWRKNTVMAVRHKSQFKET